jgi:hypothetical protein
MRAIYIACLAFIGLMVASPALTQTPTDFAVGQRWSLSNSDYAAVSLTIGRIEVLNDKTIIHISLHSIPLPDGEKIEVAHMPFSEMSLRASVGRLLTTGDSPHDEFETGYADWRKHQGGYYTITVPEAISVMVASLFAR